MKMIQVKGSKRQLQDGMFHPAVDPSLPAWWKGRHIRLALGRPNGRPGYAGSIPVAGTSIIQAQSTEI
jgi:hypothetical protein